MRQISIHTKQFVQTDLKIEKLLPFTEQFIYSKELKQNKKAIKVHFHPPGNKTLNLYWTHDKNHTYIIKSSFFRNSSKFLDLAKIATILFTLLKLELF